MRTFDIAVKYLKESGADFKKIDLYDSNDAKFPNEIYDVALKNFLHDPENNKSNDWYRRMVFFTAISHLAFLSNGIASCFDVACEIVESEKKILLTDFLRYGRTGYPKKMTDKFVDYCNNLNPRPAIFSDDSETGIHIFFAAFHYTLEPFTA